jgi:hypothetical protein
LNIIIETDNGPVVLESATAATNTTPNGSYWRIEYRYKGETVYACNSRLLPPGVQPGPLEALDWKRTLKDEDGQDYSASNREHLLDVLEEVVL